MRIDSKKIDSALAHLRRNDGTMRRVIRQVGPFTLRLHRDRFAMLVRSILSQQISTQAARTIRGRLESRAGGLTPEALCKLSVEDYRSAGVSRQKAEYIRDIATKTSSGELSLNQMGRWSDERVIAELTQVKGIGRWTAQMFLIFSLGRLDVFPYDDLGIRAAIRRLYELDELPGKAESLSIAEPWRPYATVASWYCWRSIDAKNPV